MSERYRLNLETPFLQSDRSIRHLSGTNSFRRAAANEAQSNQKTDTFLRRPSPRNRGEGGDYTGETMAGYINGLEKRMLAHLRKHSPRWHERETAKILRRWSAPQFHAPAPRWAPPIDRQAAARDYAAALLHERLRTRMDRFGEIRAALLMNDGDRHQPRRSLRMKQ